MFNINTKKNCKWTCQGEFVCSGEKQVHPTSNIEHFVQYSSDSYFRSYSFNVFLYTSQNELIEKHMFTNIVPEKRPLLKIMRPTDVQMYGDKVILKITDVTNYESRPSLRPLKLNIITNARSAPIPVTFSPRHPISNIYYRTAEIPITGYNGFDLQFDLNSLVPR